MDRRAMLKILGAAVAVATLPIPLPAELVTHEFYSDNEAAFVVIDAPHDVTAAHFVLWNGMPLGIACDKARRGQRVLVQVRGPARVTVAA